MRIFIKILLIICFSVSSYCFAKNMQIRVGSTFDYPPLTYTESDIYIGRDIKIIKDFAKSNNIDIVFIKTTWPNLNQDLINHKFDIAVGGISINDTRQKLFLFSSPISQTKKAALILCENITKFKTLASINNPMTNIVENKGGTNETFAKSTTPNANIIIVQNNILPFKYLLNKTADIMFTDDIEINYKHTQDQRFCHALVNVNSPVASKVFLFNKTPSGEKLQHQFNAWWINNQTK